MKTDTIIIGSGIAGLNFALNAAKFGKVLVITKKRTVESSTNRAQGGIAAVLDKTDDFEQHVKDTLKAGAHHNNKKAVEFMVKNGPEAVMKLIEIGVPFATNKEGKMLLTKEGGHNKRRIAFVGDYTGKEIEKALIESVSKNPNISIWEYTFAVDLLIKDNTCYGVQVIHNDKTMNLFASNTVLATGGFGQVYQYTTNPAISTGDGLAMGIRAKLKTKDLEFVQFHPTALKVGGRTKFLLSEALRGEGAKLKTKKGKQFMKGIHPLIDLAPRDIVARQVYKHDLIDGAFLDMRHLNSTETKVRFPQIYQKCKQYKLDITKDLIPISPAAHYTCGGLVTNLKGETSINQLYAFGEVTYTGVHGANRLASNSLLEALVFSNQIIKGLKTNLKNKSPRFSKKAYKSNTPQQWAKLKRQRQKIRHIMWENVGIIRTKEGLTKAIESLKKLEGKLPHSKTLNVAEKENENMIQVGIAIASAGLKREKSLGAHSIQ
jgi:L-aspartate oxidase